jgi:hypothetical protein
MLRIPHCLDTLLTDGGKVVSPTHPTPQKHFSASGGHLCQRLSEITSRGGKQQRGQEGRGKGVKVKEEKEYDNV